jgi:large subunit ribosomal protein L6
MSRIGLKPLKTAAGVTVTSAAGAVTVKGPKGSLTLPLPAGITVESKDGVVTVRRADEAKQTRANHGTVRSILENHIQGVVTPFQKSLEIQGVGFQASKKGPNLALKVGFANEVLMDVPAGVQVDLPSGTMVVVSGCDRQAVGEFAARVRKVRPPEPYNGKGIRYVGEHVERKAGKSFASTGG